MQLSANTTYSIVFQLNGFDNNQTPQSLTVGSTTTFQDVCDFFDICYYSITDVGLNDGSNTITLSLADQTDLGLTTLRALQGVFIYGKNIQTYTDTDCTTAFNLWSTSTFATNANGDISSVSFKGVDSAVTLVTSFELYRSYINQVATVATTKRFLLQNNL